MNIKSDVLHSVFVKLLSCAFLNGRDIIRGFWDEAKCICLSFDCDYPKDMVDCESIIDLLRDEKISASFAVPGHLITAFPNTIEEILKNGHEILNHTFSHFPNFRNMNGDDMRLEIEKLQELMIDNYNYLPKGFRSPHGLRKRTVELFEMLRQNNMYDSSLLGYGVTNMNGTWEIPLTPCPDHPLMAFDTYHHFRFPVFSASTKKVLQLWMLLLQRNLFVNVFFDPIDLSEESGLNLLNQMIQSAKDSGFTFTQMGKLHEDLNNIQRHVATPSELNYVP